MGKAAKAVASQPLHGRLGFFGTLGILLAVLIWFPIIVILAAVDIGISSVPFMPIRISCLADASIYNAGYPAVLIVLRCHGVTASSL